MYDLSGKVAIVTGCGRRGGIGGGIALRLAKEGADVALVDICCAYDPDPEYYRGTWEELLERKGEIEALGVRCLPVKCDVTNEKEVDEMVEAVVREFGHIDILCNNVGIGPPKSGGPLLEVDAFYWDEGMAVNVKGAHLCSRAVAKRMIEQGTGGKIINTSSQAGLRPFPYLGVYCSAKAALINYTKVLALELAPHKINVNAVCPGTIETESLKEGFTKVAEQYLGITYEQLMQAMPPIPLGRLQTPEDVANLVVWLASGESDYVTGEAILTTGGQTMA